MHRVDGRSDLWGVEVGPSGDADLTVRLNASPACGDPATTMCTADGRRVETAIETTVPGPEEAVDETPLTVSVSDMPAEHGGADAVFTFRLTFSEPLASNYSYKTMRDRSLGVWQGEHLRATNARRLEPPSNRYWEITITPIDAQDISISLGPTFECTDNGAMCTEDGRKLSNAFTRLVRGPTPSGIVVGDALSMTWPSPRRRVRVAVGDGFCGARRRRAARGDRGGTRRPHGDAGAGGAGDRRRHGDGGLPGLGHAPAGGMLREPCARRPGSTWRSRT